MHAQFLSIAVLAVSGVVLGAWYMLWLVQRTFFGPLREPAHEPGHAPVSDLRWTEIAGPGAAGWCSSSGSGFSRATFWIA